MCEEKNKKLYDQLRKIREQIDKALGTLDGILWCECSMCGKRIADEEIHGYLEKDQEVLVCYDCIVRREEELEKEARERKNTKYW